MNQDTSWQLWRMDDNGNSFLVETYREEEEARLALLKLERAGHKQTYWLVEVSQ